MIPVQFPIKKTHQLGDWLTMLLKLPGSISTVTSQSIAKPKSSRTLRKIRRKSYIRGILGDFIVNQQK